jgi:homoserine O-succinyltransferase
MIEFEDLIYWEELQQIMAWSKTHVFSTLHICAGAQAGLYYHYGVPKHLLAEKLFGVFPHTKNMENVPLLRGFDDEFQVPHSRYSEIRREDIEKLRNWRLLAESPQAGIYIVSSKDGRLDFCYGHSEYDADTLKREYELILPKDLILLSPATIIPNDDPGRKPLVSWRSHANLLFTNWLNYHVYQETPYDLDELK